MQPESHTVEVARAETERGELVLRERRAPGVHPVLELRAGGVFVMDTAETSTERALATAELGRVASPRSVVVAGLGLGFTAREVLDDPRVERLAVVEIEPALVGWMREGTVPHGPALLADARLRVVVADIAAALAEARPASHDLLLLDVDNGPDQLVHQANAVLYDEPLLRRAREVLRPGGVLAIWSATASPPLAERLARVFERAATLAVPVDLQGRAERYWLHLGTREGGSGSSSVKG